MPGRTCAEHRRRSLDGAGLARVDHGQPTLRRNPGTDGCDSADARGASKKPGIRPPGRAPPLQHSPASARLSPYGGWTRVLSRTAGPTIVGRDLVEVREGGACHSLHSYPVREGSGTRPGVSELRRGDAPRPTRAPI